jgi:hypothetical protein
MLRSRSRRMWRPPGRPTGERDRGGRGREIVSRKAPCRHRAIAPRRRLYWRTGHDRRWAAARGSLDRAPIRDHRAPGVGRIEADRRREEARPCLYPFPSPSSRCSPRRRTGCPRARLAVRAEVGRFPDAGLPRRRGDRAAEPRPKPMNRYFPSWSRRSGRAAGALRARR